MILYSERSWCVALSHIETLGLTNFRVAALIAVLASIATAGLIVLDNWAFDAPSSALWGSRSTMILFMLILMCVSVSVSVCVCVL